MNRRTLLGALAGAAVTVPALSACSSGVTSLDGQGSSSGGGGTVVYRFDRAEGLDGPTQHGPVQLATFAAPGTQTIRHEEDVNITAGTQHFRELLTVISPGNRQSSPVSVTVKCDPAAPRGQGSSQP